jgi:hypothetical protein
MMVVRDSTEAMIVKKGLEATSTWRFSQIKKSLTTWLMLTSRVVDLQSHTTVDKTMPTKCYQWLKTVNRWTKNSNHNLLKHLNSIKFMNKLLRRSTQFIWNAILMMKKSSSKPFFKKSPTRLTLPKVCTQREKLNKSFSLVSQRSKNQLTSNTWLLSSTTSLTNSMKNH